MDATEWFRKCPCGQAFYKPNSFSNHINSCKRYKKDLGATLESARARYAAKAKPKKGTQAIETWLGDSSLDVDQAISQPSQPLTSDTRATPEEPEPERPEGRGFRLRTPTKRFKDFLVTSAIPLVIPMAGEAIESPRSTPPPPNAPASTAETKRLSVLDSAHWRKTQQNDFGLYKVFWTGESQPHDPDLYVSDLDLDDGDDGDVPPQLLVSLNKYYLFPNWSSYMLGDWYWDDRSGKSRESFQQLVNIISDPSFKPDDIRGTNWKKVNDLLASDELDTFPGQGLQEDEGWADEDTFWRSVPLMVDVPFNKTSITPGEQRYQVDGFRYRPLIPIILARLMDSEACDHFHIVPSELRWHTGRDEGGIRVYSDLYHSDAFLDAYKEIQLLPAEPEQDDLPRCVVALMFASDETMLTSFGNVKLWPLYLSFGNETKYRRGKVSLKLFEEVAYFQSLPDAFYDWYLQLSGKKVVGDPVLTHVRRELFHAQWKILLDDDFIRAYRNGLVVDCPDGVRRRFYPRIMTYSADYPERVKVVGIRNLGDYPCPRCLTPMHDLQFMGTPSDRVLRMTLQREDSEARRNRVSSARRSIYKGNYSVNATVVEKQLKSTSLVPAQVSLASFYHPMTLLLTTVLTGKNAFSEQLSVFGFDMHRILAVDVLHEVEIGIWKSLFIHLLRLLEAIDTASIGTLNSRFRQMPTFGRDTIRRFSKNVSDRKQFGAREYEDLLQCAIPAFEGLLPDEHGDRVQHLLYTLATWHGFAKLRMHTDQSLDALDSWTTILGEDARAFTTMTCDSFETRKLKKEYEARVRGVARKKSSKAPKRSSRATVNPNSSTIGTEGSEDHSAEGGGGRKHRSWNLSTPKFHGLGDVVACIRRFGTTDSYSTQMVCLMPPAEHMPPVSEDEQEECPSAIITDTYKASKNQEAPRPDIPVPGRERP
ncbi:hypothetical protein NMY22_g15405 [Coprinellus aureogranulatus]|nr:hypothetical protein NMY22_g15405 [Coprinellus aureogranulatus]